MIDAGDVWLRSGETEVGPWTDSRVVLALLPAMRTGTSLRLPNGVSPRLAAALPSIQEVFAGFDRVWGAGFRSVPIAGPTQPAAALPEPGSGGVVCLFSGGVDSFYSALKHRDRITHLLFVHGFDIPLDDSDLRGAASATARAAADHLGAELIEIETDLRAVVFDSLEIDWRHAHGAALAAVALLFQHLFAKVIVPATFNYGSLEPWGTHPLIDPLWSTERTAFAHDGCEAPRPDKVVAIARDDVAMATLRVCWENRDGRYNCGRCEKCVRTMINLRIAGALERCATLPDELDFDAIDAIPVYRRHFLIENLAAIAAMSEPDAQLESALREVLRRHDERARDDARVAELEDRLAIMRSSRSWRATEPLRRVAGAARRLRG